MSENVIKIECDNINDWDSFHDEFDGAFGFPEFYGRNMNAWIDCMSYLSEPSEKMTQIHCQAGSVITIELLNVKDFKSRCPEQYDAIIECTAFVNWCLIDTGQRPVLALSFN